MKSWYRFSFAFLVLLCGCSEDTEVRTYTVAKKIAPALPSAAPQPAQTLGVIVPNKDTAWFLKLMDDPAKVSPLANDFRKLAGSLEFDEQGKPRWKLTAGWTEQILDSITYAKFSHEGGATATLTKLAANTAEGSQWQAYLLDNINRWRDQLGLTKQDWQAMQPGLEEVPELSTETAKAYFVSLEGMRKSGGMGMGSGAPFLDRMRAQQAQQGQAQPEQAAATSASSTQTPTPQTPSPQASGRPQLKYQLPAGWNDVATTSGIRLATFEVKDQNQTASVIISVASGALDATIQMWFQQVGVEPDQQRVQTTIETATTGSVQGQDYKCYRLQGDGDAATAIRVAVISMGNNQNMFVKMTGPAALVDAQSAAMDQLIQSLQW